MGRLYKQFDRYLDVYSEQKESPSPNSSHPRKSQTSEMKTIIILENGLADFDELIMAKLGLREAAPEEFRHSHMKIGVRNEYRKIYREIGIIRLADMLRICDVFSELGFIEEYGGSFEDKDGYMAIFQPGPLQ